MTTKQRWEQILEEFWSSDEDTTYTTLERELAEHIAELEQHIKELTEPTPDEAALNRYARDKKDWISEETLNTDGSMMLKPFLESVEFFQKEVYCDGKGGIASHNIPSSVFVKVVNPKTGEDMWANVKWIEASMLMGCGCWDGIKIVAELD